MLQEKVAVLDGNVYRAPHPLGNAVAQIFCSGSTSGLDTNHVETMDARLSRLEAIEATPPSTNTAIGVRKRIERLYKARGVEDWNFERLRFGVATFYNDKLGGIGSGVVIRGYPAYSRYLTGRFLDLENLFWRRLSLQFGTGGMLTKDDDKADVTGLAVTTGVGLDIIHGISLFAGRSFYQYSAPEGTGEHRGNTTVFGVTLNAELWQKLFGSSGK